jgi:hypothetical protein
MALSFEFGHDRHWLEVDMTMAPEAWAAKQMWWIWSTAELPTDRRHQKIVTKQLALLARCEQPILPEAIYILCPTLGQAPVARMEVIGGDWPEGEFTQEAIVKEVVFEDEHAVSLPQVSDLHTSAGRAVRVRQRYFVSLDPPRDMIDVIHYVWVVPEEKAVLAASIRFVDLSKTDALAPMVDTFARQCFITIEAEPDNSSRPNAAAVRVKSHRITRRPPDTRFPGPREIRAVQPDGVRFAGLPGGLHDLANRALLRVDPEAGTLTWTSDVKSRGTIIMRLPGHDAPVDIPDIHTLCIAMSYGRTVPRPSECMVFVNQRNQAIATSLKNDSRNFDRLWPPGLLEQLEDYNIIVSRQTFKNLRRLNKTYPGASRHWYLRDYPYFIGVFLGPILLVLVIVTFLFGSGLL